MQIGITCQDFARRGVGCGREKAAIHSKFLPIQKNPYRKFANGLYNPHKETYGRRYSNYVQRLRAGFYLHRC